MELRYSIKIGNETHEVVREFEISKAERLTDIYELLSLLSYITVEGKPILRVIWHFLFPNSTYLEVVPLASNSRYECHLLPSEITYSLLGTNDSILIASSDGVRVTSDDLKFQVVDYVRPFCPSWNRKGKPGKDGKDGKDGPQGFQGPQGPQGPTGRGGSYRNWHIVN